MLVVVAKSTNHDVAAEHGEEQQRGTQQRRAQPADRVITLSAGCLSMRTTGACDVRATSAASKHSLWSCMSAVVCPCCCTSCCTELAF
jgi:hypothetical protein